MYKSEIKILKLNNIPECNSFNKNEKLNKESNILNIFNINL